MAAHRSLVLRGFHSRSEYLAVNGPVAGMGSLAAGAYRRNRRWGRLFRPAVLRLLLALAASPPAAHAASRRKGGSHPGARGACVAAEFLFPYSCAARPQ